MTLKSRYCTKVRCSVVQATWRVANSVKLGVVLNKLLQNEP